jgi:transcriptional regulator with XRE-family HTH domain
MLSSTFRQPTESFISKEEGMEKTAGQVFADRMAEVLKSRGWKKTDLAKRLEELGHPMHPVVLGRIAQGQTRATNVSLEDVLAIAYALEVPPAQMMYPYDKETSVRIVGNRPAVAPSELYRWTVGFEPLEGIDQTRYVLELPPEQLVTLAEGYRMRAVDAGLLGYMKEREDDGDSH